MRTTVPKPTVKRIAFFETHTTPWNSNAVAIGTTTAAVTDLTTKTTAARAAYGAQQVAQDAAKSATLTLNLALEAMADAGADIIKQIRAKAASSGDNVYVLASIPAPSRRSPRPAPGTPTDFNVSLDGNGVLRLRWKCPNPAGTTGTMYQVWRRIASAGGAAGEFAYLGGSGTKSFVDDTLPAGSVDVSYQIQAVRSTAAGPWAQFNVNFGVNSNRASGGGTAASVQAKTVATSPAKRAA